MAKKKLTNVVLCCYLNSNMAHVVPVAGQVLQFIIGVGEVWKAVNDLLSSGSGQHNLVVGNSEAGDIVLYKEQKSQGYEFGWGSHVYQYSGDKKITAVVAHDNRNDDTGGDPEIIRGGPGYKHVSVKVTSRFGRGFDHTVYVYGKKKKLNCTLF